MSNKLHRWTTWIVPVAILAASVVHSVVVGTRIKNDKKKKQKLLRIFVGYYIGGLCLWLAIVYLFLPKSFSPDILQGSSEARRVSGFSCLAFSVGGIISAANNSILEQRVAIATYSVFMIGVAGVQLYSLGKNKSRPVKVYSIPLVKLITTIILITMRAITPSTV